MGELLCDAGHSLALADKTKAMPDLNGLSRLQLNGTGMTAQAIGCMQKMGSQPWVLQLSDVQLHWPCLDANMTPPRIAGACRTAFAKSEGATANRSIVYSNDLRLIHDALGKLMTPTRTTTPQMGVSTSSQTDQTSVVDLGALTPLKADSRVAASGGKRSNGQGRAANRSPSVKLAQGVSDYPATLDPKTGRLTPIFKAVPNQVTVNGMTVVKYPSQSDLTRVRTGADYPQAAMDKLNPTVYVLDNFQDKEVTVGAGFHRNAMTHGDWCMSIVKAGLPNANVLPVSALNANGGMSTGGLVNGLNQIVAREASIQKTSKPDLSRVFVSMSIGDSVNRLVPPDPRVQAAIAKFTDMGGTLYASAGNDVLNTTGIFQGVGFVYASEARSGSTLSSNPRVSPNLRSGSYAPSGGLVEIEKIPNNQIASSSHAYLGAGKVVNRYNPSTGNVEIKNVNDRWVPAVSADKVSPMPVPGMAPVAPFEFQQPSAVLTPKEVSNFGLWRQKQNREALQAYQKLPGMKAVVDVGALPQSTVDVLNQTAAAEFQRRFGPTSVISIADVRILTGVAQGSSRADAMDQALPDGLTARTAFVSAQDELLLERKVERGQAYIYSQDSAGVLRSARSQTTSSVSTSAATPDVVVRAVQDRAVRLANSQKPR